MCSWLKNTFFWLYTATLAGLFYFWINAWLKKLLSNREARKLQDEYDALSTENRQCKAHSSSLETASNEMAALYDIAKEICRTFDEEKLFRQFRESLARHVALGDCKLIEPDEDLSAYAAYTVLPLEIEKQSYGYLVASNIAEEDRYKFYILSQQFILGMKRALLYRKVQELAITDSLTGAFSRRYFLERLKEEIERSGKMKSKFAFLMIDVDHFKNCNDHYGHLVGDAILKSVSGGIKENVRQVDLVGKYGGDEFSLILSEADAEEAGFVAERIRKNIEARQIRAYDEELKITVSIGIAVFPAAAKTQNSLIEKADVALYRAKQEGRNRVRIAESPK